MNETGFLLKISRPRFWLYVFGPYIVGLAAGASSHPEILTWKALFFAIYFLFPANLLIYGINDIFDHDTDLANEKKSGYEARVEAAYQKRLLLWILVFNLPFIVAGALLVPAAVWPLAGFLFFAVFYSAPPVRAKSIPMLDSAFNILYVFPAVLAYRMLSGEFPPAAVLAAAACWTAAMHAYSAVPDIAADRAAGVATIAAFSGAKITLAVCGVLYAAAAVISYPYLSYLSLILGAVYVALVLVSFKYLAGGKLFVLYRAFPVVNAVAGFVLFWYIALNKFAF